MSKDIKKYLDKGISTLLALAIIVIVVAIVGVIVWYVASSKVFEPTSTPTPTPTPQPQPTSTPTSTPMPTFGPILESDDFDGWINLSIIGWTTEFVNKYHRCPILEGEHKYNYPNDCDSGENDYSAYVPEDQFYHFSSIPFNNGDKILRAYFPLNEEYFNDVEISLIIYDQQKKTSGLAGIIKVKLGASSSGLYLPHAIVGDDSGIILASCMGMPGAGGGSVNYGYGLFSFESKEIEWIAISNADFYDSFKKAIYVTEGDKTPHYSMPGPSNNASIHIVDIITREDNILLEETDTSYETLSIDEGSGVLNFKATKYTFTEECPRKEGALSCAETEIEGRRFVKLP